tara:strand:- start:4763 stop:5500 length:738 start_codon:yes stop_codon:yes gene_type:complete
MYSNLKKKYGQNFLIDKNILNKIHKLIKKDGLNIIEIGPGAGHLTDFIIKRNPIKLTLIEIDSDLIINLEQKFKKFKNINIINSDVMKYQLNIDNDLIISNLPYNISSQILVKICLFEKIPQNLILMFQKEFAARLLENKLNSLNALINCFYDLKLEFHISKNCYRPIPKVDSSVISFVKKKKFLINKNEITKYIEFKRFLFSHKRKSLKNLLKNTKLSNKFDLSKRVEDLSLVNLIKIFREIKI